LSVPPLVPIGPDKTVSAAATLPLREAACIRLGDV